MRSASAWGPGTASKHLIRHAGQPQRRLADPGLTLQHERRWTRLKALDERLHYSELVLAPDDGRCLRRHRDRNRGGASSRGSAAGRFSHLMF
jgi:hypothetical protein